MIRIENVTFRHRSAPILHNINLDIPKGGIVALIGPNGAGKSTLLSLISRLLPLQAGTISVNGLPVATTPGRALAKVIAILRQDTTIASRLRVRELVSFGRFPHSQGRLSAEDRDIVDDAIRQFGLAGLEDRFVETLSGGQRQRVLVAITLAQDADYLLLDEPLNNLDMYHARELMHLLRSAADEKGKTIVLVLHDINQASVHADRIIALKAGRVAADLPPEEIIRPDVLEDIFGFPMIVEEIHGKRFALHQL